MAVNPAWLAKRLLGQSIPETYRECRRCGARVDPGCEACPGCGATEIASYRIS